MGEEIKKILFDLSKGVISGDVIGAFILALVTLAIAILKEYLKENRKNQENPWRYKTQEEYDKETERWHKQSRQWNNETEKWTPLWTITLIVSFAIIIWFAIALHNSMK